MKWIWVCVFVCSLVSPVRAAESPKTAQIVKVHHDTFPQKHESALSREITPNETGKFKHLREDFAPKPDGDYFTVVWKSLAREPLHNVIVTLQYRQLNDPKLQTTTIQLPQVGRGTTTSKFQVVGDAFARGGVVTAWRAEVSSNGAVLDSFHSFLWKDPS